MSNGSRKYVMVLTTLVRSIVVRLFMLSVPDQSIGFINVLPFRTICMCCFYVYMSGHYFVIVS